MSAFFWLGFLVMVFVVFALVVLWIDRDRRTSIPVEPEPEPEPEPPAVADWLDDDDVDWIIALMTVLEKTGRIGND